jgi:hypothetical protein
MGVLLPLIYTLQLERQHRLFLRADAAVQQSRSRISALMPVGWLLGVAGLVLLAAAGGSGKAVVYGALGGAAIGFWPGLLVSFIRLYREEWAPGRLLSAQRRSRPH